MVAGSSFSLFLKENTGDVIHLWKPDPCLKRIRLGFDPITSRKDAIV